MALDKVSLENGLRVLLDFQETETVSVFCLVRVGSDIEDAKVSGVSHFLEHVLFNGPEHLTKKDLSERIDSIGGEINAFTSNKITVFYVKVLSKYFDKAFQTIEDLILNTFFKEQEIEDEKKIILSEINQTKDNPERIIFDYLQEEMFPNHPYGKHVIGTEETVKKMTKKDIENHFKKYYVPNNMVLGISGKFDKEEVLKKIQGTFGKREKTDLQEEFFPIPKKILKQKIEERDLNATHLGLALRVMNSKSSEAYAMNLINAILGGGLSSRLLQEIREKRGLAYTVHTVFDVNPEYGLFIIYAGIEEKNIETVKEVIFQEFNKLVTDLTEADLIKAKQFIEGKTLMKNEDTTERTKNNLELDYYGEDSTEEFLKKINAVSVEEVKEVAKKYLQTKEYSFVLIKPKSRPSNY